MFDTQYSFRGGRGRRRLVLLAAAVAVPLAVLAQAAPALAVGSPQVTITCAATNNCTANGTGFTPGGKVQVQALAGSTTFYTSSLVADPPDQVCVTGLKPHCYNVGGGGFSADLPVDYGLVCNATAAGTIQYTNVSTGVTVSKPVTWTGPCVAPTTTTLSIPSTMDTGWSAANPARVTAGSTAVTSGTITITVNGVPACSYPADASSGCTLAGLPAGTDQVQASYSGSTIPPYDPSSASATVTVVPVQPTGRTSTPNWAGYVATGGTFTAASASWTVPAAHCDGAVATTSATWVGIDGWNGNTVEQIGTDSNCTVFNASYWAWYQMYPNGPVVIGAVPANNPVYAGDSMDASVTYTGTPGSYKLTIQDNTAGWAYSTTQSISGATGGSAECITERPDALGLPLADFGSATFSQCDAATGTGPSRPIWDYQNLAVDMTTSGGTPLAKVSSLSNDGTQFTVTWQNGS
jgi:peptidase A4-like protein